MLYGSVCSELRRWHWLQSEETWEPRRSDSGNARSVWAARWRRCIHQHQVHDSVVRVVHASVNQCRLQRITLALQKIVPEHRLYHNVLLLTLEFSCFAIKPTVMDWLIDWLMKSCFAYKYANLWEQYCIAIFLVSDVRRTGSLNVLYELHHWRKLGAKFGGRKIFFCHPPNFPILGGGIEELQISQFGGASRNSLYVETKW